MKSQAGKSRTMEDALRSMEQLVSSRVGIGRALARVPRQSGEPRVHLFSTEPALRGPRDVRPARESCGGAGFTPEEGKLSALGELVEGYCAASMKPEDAVFGSYSELRRYHELLEPERFTLFSERQYTSPGFPFQRFTQDTPTSWVPGYSLVQRKTLLVPASRVYLPAATREDEPDIGPTISTGLAAGNSLECAIISGLYECIERDAFTLFWMNEALVRRIDLNGSSLNTPAGQLFHERLSVPGYDYRAYDVTSDLGVTAVYALLICPSHRGPLYIAGAASRLDGGQATLKALLETVQGKQHVLHQLGLRPGFRPEADFSNITNFSITAMLYTAVEELRPYLLGVEGRVTSKVTMEGLPHFGPADASLELGELVRRLEARGYEAVVVDLTTPEVEALGLKVVRVLTPELQPLHADYRWPFLGGRRLYEVPVRLGHRRECSDEVQLSRYPHPFP